MSRPTRPVPSSILLAAALLGGGALLLPGTADAQGFGIYEHGTCVMGRGGAAVAEPCGDGSAIFFNPAGLAGIEGVTLSGGLTLIAASGEYAADRTGETWELENDPIPVPHLYAVWGIDDRLAAGVGVFAPYGLETHWPESRDAGFPGRFMGYENVLQTIYVQPTVAYAPNGWLSVGAGLDLVFGKVELNQRLDLFEQVIDPQTGTTFGQVGIPFRTPFADASLESDYGTALGGSFGIQVRPTGRLTAGVRYTTQVTVDYEGDATFDPVSTGLTIPSDLALGDRTIPAGTPVDALVASQFQPGGSLVDQGVTTSITMPDQLVVGLAYRASERLLVEADWQWVNWEDFDRIVIDFDVAPNSVRIEEYTNTNGFRIGAEYAATGRLDLRGGYLIHGAAAPDRTVTPLLPEGRRNELTAGAGWEVRPGFTVDVAYQYIAQDDRRGRIREPLPGEMPTVELNGGLYSFTGHLFGATATVNF